MKIPSSLVDHSYRYHLLQKEATLFLIIVFLHENKTISREKMMGMLGSLRKGDMTRHINTYHCTINDKWYKDENMFDVMMDVFNKTDISRKIELEDFIKYVNIYINKPRNYCIDYIYSNFIKNAIDTYSNYNHLAVQELFSQFEVSFSNIQLTKYRDYEPTGYCCDDCDGDYEQYKSYRFENYVIDENKKEYKKAFASFLLSKRKIYKFNNPLPKLSQRDFV